MDPELAVKISILALVIYSTSLHELGHAFSANYFGDPTPGRHGRLTWNPLPHLSPVLTAVVIPTYLFLTGKGLFCLATTPVDPSRLRRPLLDYALVALAGPMMDFLFAGVLVGILWIPGFTTPPGERPNYLMLVLPWAAYWNVLLGIFNLLPIPPLDGYTVIRGLLPLQLRRQGDALCRSSISLIIVLLLGGHIVGRFQEPVMLLFAHVLP
ncbi:MAG: site-2 protease family protein [Planctomycetota bacterium]